MSLPTGFSQRSPSCDRHTAHSPPPRYQNATLATNSYPPADLIPYPPWPQQHYISPLDYPPHPDIPLLPMAVTLPTAPPTNRRQHRQPEPYPTIPIPASARRVSPGNSTAGSPVVPSPSPEGSITIVDSRDNADKEKKNPCWMCHKSFDRYFPSILPRDSLLTRLFTDRPSTLRKHMLVHTGEKGSLPAHTCEMCNRRFGVASNLNRHRRICPHRASASAATIASASSSVIVTDPTLSSSLASPELSNTNSNPPTPESTSASRRTRTRPPPNEHQQSEPILASSSSSSLTFDSSSPFSPSPPPASQPRRRRRRPQSHPIWVPDSLRNFDISPYLKSVPVPLPPVHPSSSSSPPSPSPSPFPPSRLPASHILSLPPSPPPPSLPYVEERDSFADLSNVTDAPYHPRGWVGRLPGPAADGMGVGGMSMAGSGGREGGVSGGRVLVF
ncbi:hypothetical protein BDY19DRAFT_908914 [Irpex rosettiformis]|uniref:Uncharacterized protein n=1 Tax=Irpex rosettiformis TaxID=378272 RepID=A0ACB8TUG1_9APHY|nr:hypothetical protein BDY19DRAFT_908914 [Irpex rosettiformis]